MSVKELKNLLKAAKESLDKTDYATALQHCKNALKIDKNSYMALVLYGVCLQETKEATEAPKAFRKAISLSPNLPLAWKGLATFYEKQNRESDRKDLLHAYVNLLKIEEDVTKMDEWARKIGVLLSLLDHNVLVSTWHELSTVSEDKKLLCLRIFFTTIGAMDENASESFMPILSGLVANDWGESGRSYTINIYKKYLKLLFNARMLDLLMKTARTLYDKYPDVVAGPQWFCKGYLEAKFGTDFYDADIPEPSEMYMVLLALVPNSYLGFTCKGVDELACREFVAACDSLSRAVQMKPTYGIAWYLLTQGQVWLHRFSEAESSARQALRHWKPSESNVQSINNCKYWLAKTLCELPEPVKWTESLRIADEFLFDSPNSNDFLPILIKCSIKLNDVERYEKYMAVINNSSEFSAGEKLLFEALWLKKNNEFEMSYELLVNAAEGEVKNYEIWLELGQLEFDKGKYKEALRCILKSTKLNEWCSVNYRYLGHIYRKQGDLTRARRCYQKAFQLSSADFEAGICLSDVFRILGLEEDNLKLLTAATHVPGARWAWLKMGLHYLSVNNPVEAVNSLRAAVRLDSSDYNVWESLGDAYLALGSYTAAMKSYQKVLEIKPQSVYPLLQIAVTKHLQELHEESVLEFREVLKLQPDFLPALNSHAVACLALMRERKSKHLNGLAADACQEAVTSWASVLRHRKDFLCVWKSLGDACVMIAELSAKYCKLTIPSWLWVANSPEDKTIELKTESEVLLLGVRCFGNAIALRPSSPELWYDLAVCYSRLSDISVEKKSSRTLAVQVVKKSLQLKNDSWAAWNLLGALSMRAETKNYPVAQHSFVKAIQLNEENAVPWCNLGALYLNLQEFVLANQCFTEAQRCNHDYVQCWVGQAILAETTGHSEALDLYRHSTQLGFHEEGALGYATLVLHKLLSTVDKSDKDFVFSIKNMHAEVLACDVLTWYTDCNANHACAFNMLGLILERLRLYKNSARAFKAALDVSSEETEDKIRINYGRVLNKTLQVAASVEVLKKIRTVSFESQCVLAEGLIKADQLADAYETYENLLESLAENDEQKSHILVAMAGVLYQLQRLDDAKYLLMQACQFSVVPVAGLFACCSMGILGSDMTLTEIALKELIFYKDDPKHLASIALLEAFSAITKGQTLEAQRGLCKTAHQHPEDPLIWLNLGLLHLILYPEGDPRAATKCFSRALLLGRSSIDISKVASLMSLGHLLAGNETECLRAAMKAVQLFPSITDNWVVLVAAAFRNLSDKTTMKQVLWLKRTLLLIGREMSPSEAVCQWLKVCQGNLDELINKLI